MTEQREPYVHDAVILMAAGGDLRAPGGNVTVALCGRVDHEPPCRLAPHYTESTATEERPDGSRRVGVRVLFATEPSLTTEVRDRISSALAVGVGPDADGVPVAWDLVSQNPGEPTEAERAQASRWIG